MFYPKDITEFVLSQPDLAARFGTLIQERNSSRGGMAAGDSVEFERWLFAEGYARAPAMRRYVVYLSAMRAHMETAQRFFAKTDPKRAGQKDEYLVMTAPEQMLYIANALYVLDSYGIRGDLLE